MSRLPALTPRQVLPALKRAGFRVTHQKGSPVYLWHEKLKKLTTVAMHNRDVPIGTLKAILKHSLLTEEQFLNLL
jgi:predicted RNA binding protein YcfA (HicA-like mRNA interferase family)